MQSSSRRYRSVVLSRRSEEHTSELQSHLNLVCRLLLEKKNNSPHSNHLLSPQFLFCVRLRQCVLNVLTARSLNIDIHVNWENPCFHCSNIPIFARFIES